MLATWPASRHMPRRIPSGLAFPRIVSPLFASPRFVSSRFVSSRLGPSLVSPLFSPLYYFVSRLSPLVSRLPFVSPRLGSPRHVSCILFSSLFVRLASPRLASPFFASSRLVSIRLATSRMASSRFVSSRLISSRLVPVRVIIVSPRLVSSRLFLSRLASFRIASPRLVSCLASPRPGPPCRVLPRLALVGLDSARLSSARFV